MVYRILNVHGGDSSDSVLEEVVEEEHIVMQGVEEQQVGTICEITVRHRWAQFQKFYLSDVEQRIGTIFESLSGCNGAAIIPTAV